MKLIKLILGLIFLLGCNKGKEGLGKDEQPADIEMGNENYDQGLQVSDTSYHYWDLDKEIYHFDTILKVDIIQLIPIV